MAKPEGYNEEFVEFWCEDKAEGLEKLPAWQWTQENLTAGCGGPAKIFWGVSCVEGPEFYSVDAWELRNATGAGGLQKGLKALLEWARANPARLDAVWPVVLGFIPNQLREDPPRLGTLGHVIKYGSPPF